jgi:hypothetical protein
VLEPREETLTPSLYLAPYEKTAEDMEIITKPKYETPFRSKVFLMISIYLFSSTKLCTLMLLVNDSALPTALSQACQQELDAQCEYPQWEKQYDPFPMSERDELYEGECVANVCEPA